MRMARTARTHAIQATHKVRAWRLLRGLTLEGLAAAIGMSHQNLGKIERGLVPLGEEHHATLAEALNIRSADLFRDPSEMNQSESYVRIIGRVGADTSNQVVHVDADEAYDEALMPPGGSPRAVALEVVGDSMPRMAPNGTLIFFEDQRTPPTPDMLNYWVVAELEDGRVLFKRLLRGSGPNLYVLESEVGLPIENVRLRWAAEPIAIIPPKQASRIIRRAGEP